MIPIQVKLQGFMSYREEATLNFEGSPLWMLSGHNGAGKSTVFDAMRFALFGTHRLGTQQAEGLIHHDASALRVEFDFQSGPDVYRVVRTLTRSGRPTFQAFHLQGPNGPQSSSSPIPETDTKVGLKRFIDSYIGLDDTAFSSTVMLQQGKSDLLLSADATARHDLLTQIVDLAAFEQVHERAQERQKTARAHVEVLRKWLDSNPLIDKADLARLRAQIHSLQQQGQAQQEQLETTLKLQPQAKRWEELQVQIETIDKQLEAKVALFQQAEIIRSAANRLQTLETSLPLLGELLMLQNQQRELMESCARLEAELQKSQAEIQRATQQKSECQHKRETLQTQVAQLEQRRDTTNARLLEIAPLLPRFNEWKNLGHELSAFDREFDQFPPNLDDQFQQTSVALQQALEISTSLPALKALSQVRTVWREAVNVENKQKQMGIQQEEALKIVEEELKSVEEQCREIETRYSRALETRTQAATLLQSAKQAIERFAQVEQEATCHYCGQLLDEAHRTKEQTRLQSELATAEEHLQTAQAELEAILGARERAQRERTKAQDTVQDIRRQQQNTNNALQNAQREIERQIQLANQLVNDLPPRWASQVRTNETPDSNNPAELIGIFPNPTQLAELTTQAQRVPELKQQEKALNTTVQSRQRLQDQRENVRKRVETLEAECSKLPSDLPQKYTEAERDARETKNLLSSLKEELASVLSGETDADRRLSSGREHSSSLQIDLVRQQGKVNNLHSQCTKRRQDIAPEFIQKLIDTSLIQTLKNELDQLEKAEVRAKAAELATIESDHSVLQQNLERLQLESDSLPLEAKTSYQHLTSQEIELRSHLQKISDELREHESHLLTLENAKRQRTTREKELQKAEKNVRLYKYLTEALGRDGIQRRLLQEAELAIIDAANETLDRISGSELRLELRNDDTPEVAGNRKGSPRALDFVVYNTLIGQNSRPMHPAFLSGSQRFRVAVSLALGIGQYASQGKGRVESVIIDEGFGSLDKQGRNEMIEELRELRTVLKRVILVSHQEEFSEAFTDRYHIEVVNGTSRVSLVDTTGL